MADTEALTASIATIAVSDTNLTAAQDANTSLSRPNLPLPRELRDQIWGYLLRHEHVHDGMYRNRPVAKRNTTSVQNERNLSRAHTYKFHVNVLRTNRTIYGECYQVLKSNDFIIVSHKHPMRARDRHIGSLPVVTENQNDCARFKAHILRVHLQSSPTFIKRVNGEDNLKAFVMVASDLPRFCQLAHKLCFFVAFASKRVCSSEGVAGVPAPMLEDGPWVDDRNFVRTNIQFQDPTISTETAQKLLSPFRVLIHGKQRVIIQGYPQSMAQEVENVRRIMAPQTVWVNAMAWNAVQMCRRELTEARDAVEAGDLEHAVERYSVILNLCKLVCFFELPAEFYQSKAAYPLTLLCIALLDAGATEANLRLKLGGHHYYHGFDRTCEDISNVMDFIVKLPDASKDIVKTRDYTDPSFKGTLPGDAAALWCCMMGSLSDARLARVATNLAVCRTSLQGDAYFEHDYELVKELVANRDLRSQLLPHGVDGRTPQLVQRMSASAFPPRVYHNPLLDSCEPPKGIEGFVDLAAVKKLQQGYPGRYDNL